MITVDDSLYWALALATVYAVNEKTLPYVSRLYHPLYMLLRTSRYIRERDA